MDASSPIYSPSFIQKNTLSDESSYLQYGQSDDSDFYDFLFGEFKSSGWTTWPTAENPSAHFKYLSIEFQLGPDVTNWNRQTYSILDWLGDLGGLFDALRYLFALFVHPFSKFKLQTTLLTTLFRSRD